MIRDLIDRLAAWIERSSDLARRHPGLALALAIAFVVAIIVSPIPPFP